MSSAVFPSLAGLMFPVVRTQMWDTNVQASISGRENRLANWTTPKYSWEGDVSVLRSASPEDFQTLMGFVNARQGQFDSFLYMDPDDNYVAGQAIGTGDGSTTTFQFVRSLGGFIEPVLAPNYTAGVSVFLNGVLQTTGLTFTAWGNPGNPGQVVFASAPASGVAITANINYYWPCRFNSDKTSFSLDFQGLYSVKKLSWITVKN
jgi:uncharacterized protein (TIGR02217 family)